MQLNAAQRPLPPCLPPNKGDKYIRWKNNWVDFTVFGDLKHKVLHDYLGDVVKVLTNTKKHDQELKIDIVQVQFQSKTTALWVPADMV